MASPNYSQDDWAPFNLKTLGLEKKRKFDEISQPDTQSMDEDYNHDDNVWDTPSGSSEDEYTQSERIDLLYESREYLFKLIHQLEQKIALLTRMVTLNTNYCNDTSLKTWNNNPPSPPAALASH